MPGKFKYDLTNKVFGSLKVIKRVDPIKRPSIWVCECSCGKIKNIPCRHLMTGTINKCVHCTRRIKNSHCWVGEIPKHYWGRIIISAQRRNIKVDITIEQAWDLFLKQDRRCALSKEILAFPPSTQKYEFCTASLDRIDSSKNYTIDNAQWIHKDLNRMKSDFNDDIFIKWCKKVCLANS